MIKIRRRHLSILLAVVFLMVTSFSILLKECGNGEKNGFSIIMYHHISENKSMLGDYVINPLVFESDLQYLKSKGYHSITIEDLISFVHDGNALPRKAIMITFDDADESFLTYAFPLLKKYGMTAVLSVVGYYAEYYTKKADPDIPFPYLDFDQIKQLAGSGIVEIANHTYNMHENCKGKRFGTEKIVNESDEEYSKALADDKKQFDHLVGEKIGFVPIAFTYPFGAISENEPAIIQQMGFRAVFTCREQRIIPKNSKDWLLSLGRFNRAYGKSSKEFFGLVL